MQESSTVQKPHLFLLNKAATQLTKKGDLKPQKKGSPDLNSCWRSGLCDRNMGCLFCVFLGGLFDTMRFY